MLLELCLVVFCFFSLRWYVKNKNAILVHWPILGEIPSILKNAHRFHDWTVELANVVGCTIEARGSIFGRLRAVLTCDPRNVEYIASTNFSNFPKGESFIENFDVLGQGIFTTDFEQWQAQRKMATMALMSKESRSFSVKMSQEVVEGSLLPVLENAAKESTSILDLEDVFLRFAFDSVFTVVFGRNPKSLSIGLPINELAQAIDDATEAIFFRHALPKSWWKLCRWLMIGKEKKLFDAAKTIDNCLTQCIASKRKDLLKGVQQSDIIGTYMTSQELEKNELLLKGDSFLRDTALSFIFAGRDSTGSILAWLFWLIANTPRAEAKILEELELLYSKESQQKKQKPYVFSLESLKGLVYLHAALCEALRLCPPLPIIHKGVHKEDKLPDGTIVKPGTEIMISVYAMGRMERLWGKDCLDYRPERWIDEQNGKIRNILISKLYVFNIGPRNCIGREIAFTQMKLVTAAVIFNFHVEPVESQMVLPKPSVVLHMKNGFKVRIKERIL